MPALAHRTQPLWRTAAAVLLARRLERVCPTRRPAVRPGAANRPTRTRLHRRGQQGKIRRSQRFSRQDGGFGMDQCRVPVHPKALQQRQYAEACRRSRSERGVIWLTRDLLGARQAGLRRWTGGRRAVRARAMPFRPRCCSILPGRVGRLYHAKTTPHMFVIDRNGVLQYMGGIDSIATADVGRYPQGGAVSQRGHAGGGRR